MDAIHAVHKVEAHSAPETKPDYLNAWRALTITSALFRPVITSSTGGPQMSERNVTVVRRWFEEVWNQGCEASIDELFPADGVAHGLGDSEQDVRGPDEFKPFVANIRGALPDTRISIDDILEDGDRIAVRVTLQGTHTGPGLGVPPTGRKVSIQGIIIVRLVDGRIREGWNSYDQLGLLRQIGALPGGGNRDTFLSAHQ